jgi:hypothetical protein
MDRAVLRYRQRRNCPNCGRFVDLNRHGAYRRHFAIEPDGPRHLCAASGQMPEGVARLLTVDPTPEERYSHALRLMRNARLD